MKKTYKAPEMRVATLYASQSLLMTMSSYNEEDDLQDDEYFMEFDDPILWGDDKIGKGGWGEA